MWLLIRQMLVSSCSKMQHRLILLSVQGTEPNVYLLCLQVFHSLDKDTVCCKVTVMRIFKSFTPWCICSGPHFRSWYGFIKHKNLNCLTWKHTRRFPLLHSTVWIKTSFYRGFSVHFAFHTPARYCARTRWIELKSENKLKFWSQLAEAQHSSSSKGHRTAEVLPEGKNKMPTNQWRLTRHPLNLHHTRLHIYKCCTWWTFFHHLSLNPHHL